MAAGRNRVAVAGDDARRVVGVGQQVQHRDHEQPDGLREVEQVANRRGREDQRHVTQVGLNHGRGMVAGSHRAPVRRGDWIHVDVHDPDGRVDRVRDLMDVTRGRELTQVEELPESRPRTDAAPRVAGTPGGP